jgi:hypothetical protein
MRRSLAFADGGRLLVSAHPEGGLILWQTPELKRVCQLPYPAEFSLLACSDHGQHLALASIDGLVTVWDLGAIRAELKKLDLDW